MKSVKTPLALFGDLFEALHASNIWEDGKMISDAIPLFPAEEILEKYRTEKDNNNFQLKEFFEANFKAPSSTDSQFVSDTTKSPEEHIHSLWSVLLRQPDADEGDSSRISLPYPYIVPGGRFNEIYYWDSYFTMLGLGLHGKVKTIECMLDNFAWMIETYGFVPNGSRTYFLGRSQPPFFCLMVELLASATDLKVFSNYKVALQKEYNFWMDEGHQGRRKCVLTDGVLNRYHDNNPAPREEMYGDDLHLISESDRSAEDLFGSIRAACESGWDFSSRWLKDPMNLETIKTSEILPVDLNCLLYKLEQTLAMIYASDGEQQLSADYIGKAEKRRVLIQKYFWSESLGYFADYNFKKEFTLSHLNLAGAYPLFFNIATNKQAQSVAEIIENKLLAPGGLLTSTIESGQQWDAPNGWPPLQWMTIKGLDNYGHKDLAKECAQRWVSLNEKVYKASGKFVEKYNVVDLSLEAGGGEYPVQDGFGWSNGVYLALKDYLEKT